MKDKQAKKVLIFLKAIIFPIVLAFVCLFASDSIFTNAKPVAENITITDGIVQPTPADIGEEIEFSGTYSSQTQGPYGIYVCKSKKFEEPSLSCQDGSWCSSSDFSEDNPLSCKHTVTDQDNVTNSFFMFVCNQNGECSSPFPGSFSVAKNILSLQAPEQIYFRTVNFSFLPQKSSNNNLSELIVTSTGKQTGWSINLSAENWENEKGDTLVYNGDGVSTGQLTVNLDQASIDSEDSLVGITIGKTASFSKSVRSINIAKASAKNQGGVFTIKNINFDQFIPGNQKEGNYKTVLVFTIS